jgi:DNA polymerase-3 subunit epsilon
MTRGQESLGIELEQPGLARENAGAGEGGDFVRPALVVLAASAEELAAHEEMLGRIEADSKGRCLWARRARPQTTPADAAGGSRKA